MSRQGTLPKLLSADPILAALCALLLLIPSAAGAADEVGRVLVAVGGVTAERNGESARGLGRRDPIYAGDRIQTRARGRVQIRFEDGAMVDLDPGSTFEVTGYGRDEETGGGSAVMSFLKGAMRTITGAIGGSRDDDYRMNTTVATIGVRGTAYALEYCDADCAEGDGEVGLYGRVDDGEIEADAPEGSGTFASGQYFLVPEDGAPRRIVAPPDGILEGGGEVDTSDDDDRTGDVSVRPLGTGEEEGIDLGGSDTNLLDPDFESSEAFSPEREPEPEPLPGTTTAALFGGAYLGSSGSAVYESPGDGDVRIDADGRIVGAEFGDAGFIDASGLEHTGGSIELFDFANETTFDVSWGSWSSGSGPVDEGDIAGFVYTITDPANRTTAMEIENLGASGQLRFYGDGGGPPAIASDGGTWELNTLTLDVDFGSSTVEAADIVLNTADFNQTAFVNTTDSTPIDAGGSFEIADMSGSDLTETIQYEGSLEGAFLGSSADGALVAFEVREVGGEQRIVGSRVLTPQD